MAGPDLYVVKHAAQDFEEEHDVSCSVRKVTVTEV